MLKEYFLHLIQWLISFLYLIALFIIIYLFMSCKFSAKFSIIKKPKILFLNFNCIYMILINILLFHYISDLIETLLSFYILVFFLFLIIYLYLYFLFLIYVLFQNYIIIILLSIELFFLLEFLQFVKFSKHYDLSLF